MTSDVRNPSLDLTATISSVPNGPAKKDATDMVEVLKRGNMDMVVSGLVAARFVAGVAATPIGIAATSAAAGLLLRHRTVALLIATPVAALSAAIGLARRHHHHHYSTTAAPLPSLPAKPSTSAVRGADAVPSAQVSLAGDAVPTPPKGEPSPFAAVAAAPPPADDPVPLPAAVPLSPTMVNPAAAAVVEPKRAAAAAAPAGDSSDTQYGGHTDQLSYVSSSPAATLSLEAPDTPMQHRQLQPDREDSDPYVLSDNPAAIPAAAAAPGEAGPFTANGSAYEVDEFSGSVVGASEAGDLGEEVHLVKKPRRVRRIKNTKKLMRSLSNGFSQGTEGLLRRSSSSMSRSSSGLRMSFDGSSRAAGGALVDVSHPSMTKMKDFFHRLSFSGRSHDVVQPGA